MMALPVLSGNKPGPSNALQVQIPCIVFFILTPVFVGIRIWSRFKIKGGLGLEQVTSFPDFINGLRAVSNEKFLRSKSYQVEALVLVSDWTILVSFVFSLIVSALIMASAAWGFGQHVWNLSHHNKVMTFKLFYVAQAFYKLNINLTKSSILLLYLRIFVQRPFRLLCYVLLGVILSYMIATFMSSVFQCTPIARAWDKTIPGTCIDITENWYANAGFSIATDFIILVLPMPIIYRSKLPKNQKIALMFVFALGAFDMVTSIFRMQTLNLSSTSPDSTFQIASSLWTIVEENIGIICACLPMCKPILQRLFPSVFPATMKEDNYVASDGTIVHTGTGKNEWNPSRGDRDRVGIVMTTVKARTMDDNTSEESILPAPSGGTRDGLREGKRDTWDSQGIHRTREYKVTEYHK